MRAKEYFEGIRAEVVKTDKAREMLERMKAREGSELPDGRRWRRRYRPDGIRIAAHRL